MVSRPPLDLRNVTLCAADSIHPALAARALDLSGARCAFADSLLFSHEAPPGHRHTVMIPRLQSKADYSAFMLKALVEHVTTPWVLVVQWDGYVLDPAAWDDAFFEYDYIGAAWPFRRDDMNVGNGGFSLRSAKLLRALANPGFPVPDGVNEDELICRVYRPVLETHYGIRFAPPEIAARFAYEHGRPEQPTFGFHAAFNMWRHVDDATMMTIIPSLDDRTFASNEVLQLLTAYCELRKFPCIRVMYQRYRQTRGPEEIARHMLAAGVAAHLVEQHLELCERVLHRDAPGVLA